MTEIKQDYPAVLSIDYFEKSNRLTTFFRIFMIIPIFIILCFLSGQTGYASEPTDNLIIFGSGFIFVPTLLMILFRKKYPKWWFDWNLSLTKFATRVFSYLMLLTDEYPSTDEEQAVHIEIRYPDATKELKRGMPLIKWFLVIPHILILIVLYIVVILCTILSWFVILFIGNYPRKIFDFIVGVMRWSLRVFAYSFLLVTDQYPPFRLSE